VRKVTGMWYTVQGRGYFNLLPTSGRQSPIGGEVNTLKEKNCFSSLSIFSVIEPNKIMFNKQSALNRHTVRPFTESDDTRGCNNTICPLEDEQGTAGNMLRIIM